MSNKITYAQLDRFNYQIQKWVQTGDVNALFHAKDIEMFYAQFGHALEAIAEKANEFNELYLKKDVTGAYIPETVDGRQQLMFKSPEAEKEYMEKYKCWANTPIVQKPNLIVAKP